ncbi:MAG: polysaccharide biosynthesis/export family protein [Acidobacteriota bacterium]
MRSSVLICSLVLTRAVCLAQTVPSAPGPASVSTESVDTYALGTGDQVIIRAVDVEEIDNKPVPIDTRGDITLPKIGRIHAAGLTPDQLQQEIVDRLKKYVIQPDVSVYVAEMRSQPISVLGSVQTPGVHQLQGQKTLFEILSVAGGLRPDAGNTIKISRRMAWGRIPLANAADDSTGEYSVASVSIKSVMSGSNPAENIAILPHDVITVPKADMVYIVGAVRKPGGYVMGENISFTTLQVLSLAEGLDRAAATGDARIMRAVAGSNSRAEIPVDLTKVLANKTEDLPLKADDILFIPTSAAKKVGFRTLEALIQAATLVTYRVP